MTGWRRKADGTGYTREFGKVEGEDYWAGEIQKPTPNTKGVWVLQVWNQPKYAISTYPTLAAAKDAAMGLIYTARRGWEGR